MNTLNNNPFAVLTLIAAPAVLTNATSVLCFITSNRFAFVTERWRTITGELEQLNSTNQDYQVRMRQVKRLERRANLILAALRVLFASVALFATSALVALTGAVLAAVNFTFAWLFTGFLAVGGIMFSCICLAREASLALLHVSEDAALMRQHLR